MEYHDTITLKDGRECVLRNGTEQDGRTQRDVFIQTHGETDYLLTYADETTMTVEDEAQYLREKSASDREIEILAEVRWHRCRGYEGEAQAPCRVWHQRHS